VPRAVSTPDVHASTLKRFTTSLAVLPTKHLFGHRRTMMTRANFGAREAGRLFILPVTGSLDHMSTQASPHAGNHRPVADGARRQNSA